MKEEQKQKYIDTMTKKAYAYAENLLSDIKNHLKEIIMLKSTKEGIVV